MCLVALASDLGTAPVWAWTQDVGGRHVGSVMGWANMWGNFGASASSKVVPMMLLYGASSGSGQSLVFVTCACAFFIAGCAALGMDATKPLQTDSPATV
jgi:nitrate/nitrite transporter NarK